MGCAPSVPEYSYCAPSELAYPRDTRHLDVHGLSTKDPAGPSTLPLLGVGSASMVGVDDRLIGTKNNQDSFAADACLCDDTNLGLFSVMDGHGSHGDRIASMLAKELHVRVAAELSSDADDGHAEPHAGRRLSLESALRRAFLAQHVAILKQHQQPTPEQQQQQQQQQQQRSQQSSLQPTSLLQSQQPSQQPDAPLDCRVSGSTCASLFIGPSWAITANVGDSRCVAALQRTARDRLRACDWTVDQTPEVAAEQRRLLAHGARIMPWFEDMRSRTPVQRVWLPDADTPGIAISRSFGDIVAAQVGVMAEPVISSFPLTREVRFVVLATDGLWQFVSSQEAVELVGHVLEADGTVHDAAWKLVLEASERWARDGAVCDDITVCVLLMDTARLPPPSRAQGFSV